MPKRSSAWFNIREKRNFFSFKLFLNSSLPCTHLVLLVFFNLQAYFEPTDSLTKSEHIWPGILIS